MVAFRVLGFRAWGGGGGGAQGSGLAAMTRV